MAVYTVGGRYLYPRRGCWDCISHRPPVLSSQNRSWAEAHLPPAFKAAAVPGGARAPHSLHSLYAVQGHNRAQKNGSWPICCWGGRDGRIPAPMSALAASGGDGREPAGLWVEASKWCSPLRMAHYSMKVGKKERESG